jgi:hypothetical protein
VLTKRLKEDEKMPCVVIGLGKLQTFVNHLPEATRQAIDDIMGIGADMVVIEAKRLVRVRTGRLQRSIGNQHVGFCHWRFGTDLFYAGFQEYGTSKMLGQPYIHPAWINTKPRLEPAVYGVIEEYFAKYQGA